MRPPPRSRRAKVYPDSAIRDPSSAFEVSAGEDGAELEAGFGESFAATFLPVDDADRVIYLRTSLAATTA